MAGIGIACLVYFVVIRLAMGKWNSTFAFFWLAAGVVCLGLYALGRQGPLWLERGVRITFSIAAFLFLAVEIRIYMAGLKRAVRENCSYIIVPGAQVDGYRVTNSLRRRLNVAVSYMKAHPETKVIVSGGQGTGEAVTEAKAMADYLEMKGISRRRILEEAKASNTRENLEYAAAFIPDLSVPVGVATNNFHMYRTKKYAESLGYKRVVGMPAGCNRILFINYMTREFFGVCKFYIQNILPGR